MLKKITHSSATSASLVTRTVELLRHDVCNCPFNAQIRVADDQSDLKILVQLCLLLLLLLLLLLIDTCPNLCAK